MLEKNKKLEGNTIKDLRNLFGLKIEIDDIEVKDIKIFLFRLRKENKAIKDQIVIDIRNLFEYERAYYKLLRVGNFWSNNYIENESNGDRKQNTIS